MKYVGKSSINTDKNNAATLKSSVQAAVADYEASGKLLKDVVTDKVSFEVNGPSSTTFGSIDAGLKAKIEEVTAGDYPKTQSDNNGYKVTIASTGAVTVTCGALSK